MKVYNHLPLLVECLSRWQKCPSEQQFIEEYANPLRPTMGDFFDGFHEVLTGLNWKQYRNQDLTINPAERNAQPVRKPFKRQSPA